MLAIIGNLGRILDFSSAEEFALRADCQKELPDLYETDELFWYNRSSENWLLKVDNNTDFSLSS
jgi:hypothetical protein